LEYKEAETLLKDYVTGKIHGQMERRKEVLKNPPTPKEDIDIKVQTSPRYDQLEREVIKYTEDSIYNRLKSDRDTVKRFLTYVVSHDNLTYQILMSYYRDNNSWVKTAQKVNLSETQCKKRRRKKIFELCEWLEPK